MTKLEWIALSYLVFKVITYVEARYQIHKRTAFRVGGKG